MDITVDTSVVLAAICGEAGRERAIELTTGHSLIAPASLHWEVGNALSAMLKRGRITQPQANACIAAYRKVPIKRVDVDLRLSLALTGKFRIYAYDAYMLICAQQFGTPLLTLDEALRVHAGYLGIEVLEI
jgi:predicted nucleic acid-binding protein